MEKPLAKKGGRFLPASAKKCLANWVVEHYNHPFPTLEEKSTLEKKSGLTETQVENYIANWRKRVWCKRLKSASIGINLLRKGNWTDAEVAYANIIVAAYKAGHFTKKTNDSVRVILATLLRCNKMRVSKRYPASKQKKVSLFL